VRVAIFGYYGFGNLGDEAVLCAMLAHLKEVLPGLEPCVLSADPSWTEAVHGVRSVRRTDLVAVRRLFRSSDLVCSGGGSLFQDVTSWRSPLFYGLLHELARGRPVLVYAQGLGPLRRTASRAVARRAMQRAAGVTLRDRGSVHLLRSLGVDRPVEVVADPALALPAPAGASGQHLALCVRPWADVPWPAVVDGVRQAARKTGLTVRVVCLHRRADLALSREVARQLEADLALPAEPLGALEALAEARVVVGMRLHALILAAAAGVPFVGLSYDPKVSAFADSVGMPWVPVHRPEPAQLVARVVGLVVDPACAARLRQQVEALAKLARRPAQLAAQLLGVTA
jgi:polysaccharide pyruvyl transferase CsaB